MTPSVSGIYCITNTANQKFYIGSSVDIASREHTHRSCLRRNKHENPYLQGAWNKYGEAVFEWAIIEECPKEELLAREQFYLDSLQPTERTVGYNLNTQASGGLSTPETVEKFRRTIRAKYDNGYINHFKGKSHSVETKRKIGAYKKGKTVEELYGPERGKELRVKSSRKGSNNPMFGSARFGKLNPMFGVKRAWIHNPETGEFVSLVNPTDAQVGEYVKRGWKRGRGNNVKHHSVAKAVRQLDLNGRQIAVFRSVGDAASAVGSSPSNLSACLLGYGYRKSAAGYRWEFAA